MSDDEKELVFKNAGKQLHYGSLEHVERERLAKMEKQMEDVSNGSTNQPVQTSGGEYMELEQRPVAQEKRVLLNEFERRSRARQIHVSTDDSQVRALLRARQQPICLFGEGPGDRRNRLRDLISRIGGSGIDEQQLAPSSYSSQQTADESASNSSTWYHEGPDSLRLARLWLADYSIPRAKERLCEERTRRARSEAARNAEKQQLHKQLRSLTLTASQVGDARPLSAGRFSPSGEMLVTGSWSGLCRLWTASNCQPIRTLRGHTCNVSGVDFHPAVDGASSPPNDVCLASCGHDGSVKLWNLESDEPLADIEGHAPHRVSCVRFHPSGRFLATCCHDRSWRLWDLEQLDEVLHQEGHSDAVFDIAFHRDGGLAVTGGLDSYGRVWDLRTGSCIMFLDGHLKSVLAVGCSADGHTVATAGSDHSCRVWDLRQRQCIYTIAAHTNLVSSLVFEPQLGRYLITASYDNTAKVWSSDTWQPVHTLRGHDSKLMCVDVSRDGQAVMTASYDRTFKLWKSEV